MHIIVKNLIKKVNKWLGFEVVLTQEKECTSTCAGTRKRTVSKEVIALIDRISTPIPDTAYLDKKPMICHELDPVLEKFKKFLILNADAKGNLPSVQLIKNDLELTDRKIRELKTKLYDLKILDKVNQKYILNKIIN